MVSFFREQPLQIQIAGKLLVVFFAAGFTKHVDPDSGMTVNLVHVNQWLSDLDALTKTNHFGDTFDFLLQAQKFLKPLAETQGSSLDRIQVRLENNDLLGLSPSGTFEIEKSWWTTDLANQQRLQVTASFPVKSKNDLRVIEIGKVSEAFSAGAQDLFKNFALVPSVFQLYEPRSKVARIFHGQG